MIWVSLWSMEWGVQVLIAAGVISSFFPVPLSGFLESILPFFHDMVRPEREMPLYALLIAAAVGLQWLALCLWRNRLEDQGFMARLKSQVIGQAGCLALQLCGIFHIFLHQDPWWARAFLYAGMALFIALPFLRRKMRVPKMPAGIVKAAAIVLTIALLYIPDQEAALARIYMGDALQHFDQSLVAPAWAALSGDVLDVDVISAYGLGMPILAGAVAKMLGGGHVAFFAVLMWAVIIYFLLLYWFLRSWLKSVPLACAGTFVAIKLQMFHPTVFPFALAYPSTTVLRFFWDMPFLILAWRYLSRGGKQWLAGAGICAGLAVFYVSSTGLCLAMAFGLLLVAVFKGKVPRIAAYALIVPVAAFVFLAAAQGTHVFSPQFWQNLAEFNNYFLNGFGTVPVYENLLNKNFWAFAVGLLIPLVYLWTLLFCGGIWFAGRATPRDVMAMVLSCYGLLLYHYFIARSAPTSFYSVAVPFVGIVCFWASTLRREVKIAAAAVALVWLWVNPQFAAYPNVFNPLRHYPSQGLGVLSLPDGKPYFNHSVAHTARVPAPNSLGQSEEGLLIESDFKDTQALKMFFRQEFDFSTDAQLIDSLTGPRDKVALMSSFDTRILMQAKRRPFFYHVPFFLSRPLRMRSFAVPAIYTVDQVKRTIGQIEKEQPEYIFIERIYSRENTRFANPTNALQILLVYVHTHYGPGPQGQYLMALKRRAL